MMTRMRHHPVAPQEPAPPPKTGFGFDAIMARPEHGRFRRWYDATSRLPFLPSARAAVADVLSAPEEARALDRAA